MHTPEHSEPDGASLTAPARLVAGLTQLRQERIFVPPTLDEAVLRAARRHLQPRERTGFSWLRLRPWAMAAAALLFLGALAQVVIHRPWHVTPEIRFAREDINRDQRVDIRDALALAMEIQAGVHMNAELDVNGDGVVDRRDAEAIAALAVKLEKGGGS
jgi:hypothetical protein